MSFSIKKNLALPLVLLLALSLTTVGCSSDKDNPEKKKETITLAASTWDSAKVNAEIVAFILEEGYDYGTDIITAASMVELQQHTKGDIDIRIENWTKTYGDEYYSPVKDGTLIEVNEILKENEQGLYIPTYMIKGDPERGIEPVTPDLKSVFDLPQYWELFKDPEDPSKGRIIGAPTTWSTNQQLNPKMETYGLDESFTLFYPGSGTALDTAIVTAYERGEPVIAYYWGPSWMLGKYDLTALEEPEFTEEKWETYSCAWPPDRVTVTVHKNMLEQAPEVVELLRKFEMSGPKMNELLAYMHEENAEPDAAAIWFLQSNKDIWQEWLPGDITGKVAAALE